LLLLVASHALAQQGPIRHEYVPDPGSDVPRAAVEADGLHLGDEVILPPADDASPGRGEPILKSARSREVKIDTDTAAEGTLRYWEPFNPATAPFKRSVVLDRVGEDYSLTLTDPSLRPVPVGGSAEREPFWASHLVRFERRRAVPIPAVAADLRVLSLSVDPPAPVEVLRNGADAYFLRGPQGGVRRVTMLVDAPSSYFSPRVLPGILLSELRADTRIELPRGVRQAAEEVAERLGIASNDPLDRALERLVGHFRSFSAGPLRSLSGDPYVDVALGGRGVCRHRAHAFVVTAQGLGIPARYVYNEAHAFAEIWLPGSGWGRVDLGGAALSLEIEGADDKTVYRAGPDPFPQPAAYARGYSRLAGSVQGLPDAAPRALRPDETPLPGVRLSTGSRAAVQVLLDHHATSGVRGESVVAEGRVLDEQDGSLAGMRVDVYLSPDGERRGILVGSVVTGRDGRWRLVTVLPPDAPVGRYQMIAATRGDARYAPGRSR